MGAHPPENLIFSRTLEIHVDVQDGNGARCDGG